MRQDDFYAYCSLCSDPFGNPKKIDRKHARRHLRTRGHIKRKAIRAQQKAFSPGNTDEVSRIKFLLLLQYWH